MDDVDTALAKLARDIRKASIEACMSLVCQTDILTFDQKDRLNALLSILLPDPPHDRSA